MPNALWEKSKPFVVQATLVAAIGLLAWFGIRPLLQIIQTKKDDIQKLAVMREYRAKQLEQLPVLEAQHQLISQEQQKLDIILTKDRLVEFIQTLERLAVADGVSIEIESRDNAFLESKVTLTEKKEVTSKRATSSGAKDELSEEPVKKSSVVNKETGILADVPLPKYLKLTMTISGEYGAIVQYLSHLETLPYALDIIGMNIRMGEVPAGEQKAPAPVVADPFGVAKPIEPVAPEAGVLEAVFETVVYMKD